MDIKTTIAFVTLIIILKFYALQASKIVPLLMPNVHPTIDDEYLCIAFEMPKDDYEYIVGFEPNTTSSYAHHINIYSCQPGVLKKGNPQYVWDCRHKYTEKPGEYKPGKACEGEMILIYTWSMDTPTFKLPHGVGFKVGKGTGMDYLVMEIHYAFAEAFTDKTDDSGVFLKVLPSSDTSVKKRAGLMVLATGGTIPPKETVHMEVACMINDSVVIHPFAFLPHTHALGQVVSGYKVDQSGNWELIGKHYPLDIQQFYPVENKDITLTKGDILAGRCTEYNFRDIVTYIGERNEDEMCNFYMMYYVDGDEILSFEACFSRGPPDYYWRFDPLLKNVPYEVDREASTLFHPYLPLTGNDINKK